MGKKEFLLHFLENIYIFFSCFILFEKICYYYFYINTKQLINLYYYSAFYIKKYRNNEKCYIFSNFLSILILYIYYIYIENIIGDRIRNLIYFVIKNIFYHNKFENF